MVHPDNRLFCHLDGETVSAREQRRMLAIAELGFLELTHVSVFDEATQTAAHFLNVPICTLSLMDQDHQHFKSFVGLSRLGLMNDLATSRRFARLESFCAHVVDSHQVLAIEDTFAHPAFANTLLTQQYGIRAYLGVPLLTSRGLCIGTLAVMDLRSHAFTEKDVEFLELAARWSMSEFERQKLVQSHLASHLAAPPPSPQDGIRNNSSTTAVSAASVTADWSIASQLKVELLSQLTQELCTPLTSVMGMASVLIREIYGPLTSKQKEYLDIIHHSGQYLLSLVKEILELSNLRDSNHLQLTSVDIEMLCQQAISTLEQAAHRREQQIHLSVEPGRRIWLLDKNKVRQMLYHLIFSVIQASNAGSTIRIHVSHRNSNLMIAIWVSHPWLGEGLSYAEMNAHAIALPMSSLPLISQASIEALNSCQIAALEENTAIPRQSTSKNKVEKPAAQRKEQTGEALTTPNKNLGLLLSRQLVEMHNGQLFMQTASESGYRYVISLPQKAESEVI